MAKGLPFLSNCLLAVAKTIFGYAIKQASANERGVVVDKKGKELKNSDQKYLDMEKVRV